MKAPNFAIGDRVKLIHQGEAHAMSHGVVVPYRGTHDSKNPRVRWASGWGITSAAAELRHLTPEEASALPMPRLCSIDI